jgi:protein-histidine pros-kinase
MASIISKSGKLCDTGIGIKEEDIGTLFKEFEQIDRGASRQYGGTGSGRVISKKLIELHGGIDLQP